MRGCLEMRAIQRGDKSGKFIERGKNKRKSKSLAIASTNDEWCS